KCAQRVAYHRAECRDPAREVSAPPGEEGAAWLEPLGREPTPLEAVELSETVDRLLAGLDEDERPGLGLGLQGSTTRESSARPGRTHRAAAARGRAQAPRTDAARAVVAGRHG